MSQTALRWRLTIGQALIIYEKARAGAVVSEDRMRRAARRLRRQIGQVNARDAAATARAVQRYTAKRRAEGVANGTIARDLIVLRAALRKLWKDGRLKHQPYVAVPSRAASRQRWLTPAEARLLIDAIEDPETELFAQLALRTGARLSAICELTWDRVDLEGLEIDYAVPSDPWAPRRKHRAIVPITRRMSKLLRQARRRRHNDDDPRVVPLSTTTVTRHLRLAAETAGLEGVSPHVLRHTAATWLLGERSDIPLVQASRMIGHRSVAVTEQVYGHLVARHLRGAADALADLIDGELDL